MSAVHAAAAMYARMSVSSGGRLLPPFSGATVAACPSFSKLADSCLAAVFAAADKHLDEASSTPTAPHSSKSEEGFGLINIMGCMLQEATELPQLIISSPCVSSASHSRQLTDSNIVRIDDSIPLPYLS